MSAFTDFIQLELPKRPYLDSDVSEETVIVRRGVGPRQLQSVTLSEGEVLGMSGGTLQGLSVNTGSVDSLQHVQASVAPVWTITHGRGNRNAVVQIFDNSHDMVVPNNIKLNENDIVISFAIPFNGYANIIFF